MDGGCLLLDSPCPQLITRSLVCHWFKNAVLPGDVPLCKEILTSPGFRKQCISCGASFVPRGNRSVYCEGCALKIRRKKAAERKRRQRDRSRR